MPRRKSGNVAVRTPSTLHKRQLSDPSTAPNGTPGSRQSKRLRSAEHTPKSAGKSTPIRSKYFEAPDSDDDDVDDTATEEASGYDDEDSSDADISPELSSSEEADSDDTEVASARKKRGRKPGVSKSTSTPSNDKSKELWRQGVKTGLGPGKEVFIAMPKARGDGGIKYTPDKIHPNTMAFLADLKKNNDREWLKREQGLPLCPIRSDRVSSE